MFIGTSGENTDMVVNTTRNGESTIYLVENNQKMTLKEFDEAAAKNEVVYDSRIDAIIDEAVINPTIVRKSEHAGGIRYTL